MKYAYMPKCHIENIADLILVFDEARVALNECQNYEQLNTEISTTLDKLQEARIAMLDLQAFILGKQGKFNQAVDNAVAIIALDSSSLTGYLRLGSLYRLQGKQLLAIEVYDRGLKDASKNHPYYTRIAAGREVAVKQSTTRVDFVERLSIEIVDNIIALLSNKSKATCLTVSNIWCNKIVKCSKAWNTLKSVDETADAQITTVIPHIASHVENLVISTTNQHIFMRYLRGMGDCKFTVLSSLTINAKTSKHINSATMTPLSVALWQIRGTLTKFAAHFDRSVLALTLVDILFACSNLKTLEYTTTADLSSVIGDISLINKHKALVDLQITANLITEKYLRQFLSRCQQVQRLLLYGCDTTVLHTVDTICPTLKVFGYNAKGATVPELDSSVDTDLPSGLCQLYTSNGGPPVPAEDLLPLIQRNMASLEILYVNMYFDQLSSGIASTYTATLPNLKKLTLWGDVNNIIQTLILRSISGCGKLKYLLAVDCRDLNSLVDVLLSLPPLETFCISHDTNIFSGSNDLTRLFKSYARNSSIEQRCLKRVVLHHYKKIVTDTVLAALAEIRTLESVTLRGLQAVSQNGLDGFLYKLGDQVSNMTLAGMEAVTDKTLIALGNMKGLKTLRLEILKNVSNDGIMNLIKRAPKLQNVTIEKCPSITSKVTSYGKKRRISVVVN